MITPTRARARLFAGTALTVAFIGGSALAQTAPASASNGALEEVVVTATRQSNSVNKVALSIAAVTQQTLDQQGLKQSADLVRTIPGLTANPGTNSQNGLATFAIRGIVANVGAATVGTYLDDTSLTRRNNAGVSQNPGANQPVLYDLERVEVLKGPQGTLYGGSSEGGTIRFITPTPSLTTYSGTARVGVSTVNGGGIGNEEGFAIGGPIVQDKLGFRLSAFRQDRPGWINAYSEYDGHQFGSQINKGNDYALRASALWQVTPDFKATLSIMNQMNYDQDSSTVRTSSPALNIPVRTLSNCNIKGLSAAQVASNGAFPGCGTTGTQNVSYSFPASVYGGYTVPATPWLSNSLRNGSINGEYLTPQDVVYLPSPHRTMFTIPSLTLDYNWHDKFAFKSITAVDSDRTSGDSFAGGGGERTSNLPYLTNQPCPSGVGLVTPILTAANACTINTPYLQFASTPTTPGVQSPNPTGAPGPANIVQNYFYRNERQQVTQEFRISTIDPSWRFQFVAGAFIEHELDTMTLCAPYGEAPFAALIRGPNGEAYNNGALNVPLCQTPGAPLTDVAARDEEVSEDEQSIFGEASFNITHALKLTAGVRVTNYTQGFWTRYSGPISGGVAGWSGSSSTGATITENGVTSPFETNPYSTTPFASNYGACPVKPESVNTTALQAQYAAAGCPYQYTVGTLHEHPVTPKLGLSYQLNPSDLLYVTYSEGQRPGGINPPASPILCAPTFALLGITGSPPTYQHDTVKSTEVGGKFRLFDGQAQLNASAFHIDWEGVQFVVPLPSCTGFSFVANAGTAASDGAEVSAQGRIWGFTLNGNLAYDNARFTKSVYGPHAPGAVPTALLANAGDNLGIPDWTANLGVQYDWHTFELPTYARVDYAYQGSYMRANSLGTTGFTPAVTPNYITGTPTHIMNLRAGIYFKNLEIAGYVKNVGDSREWINLNQATGNYFLTGTTVTPRTVGMQMNYRF